MIWWCACLTASWAASCCPFSASPTARHHATTSPASFPGAGGSADRGSIQGWRDAAPRETDPSILVFAASMASTCVEINQCVGCTDNSSLTHFSAMPRPSWPGRAVRNRHSHAIEQASRRWRGGRRDDERAANFDFHTGFYISQSLLQSEFARLQSVLPGAGRPRGVPNRRRQRRWCPGQDLRRRRARIRQGISFCASVRGRGRLRRPRSCNRALYAAELLHGAQPDISRSWQHTLALRLPFNGFLGFVRLFLSLLCLFISFVGGLGRLRREPVGLVGRFGLGRRLLLRQALRLGLCGNQISERPTRWRADSTPSTRGCLQSLRLLDGVQVDESLRNK